MSARAHALLQLPASFTARGSEDPAANDVSIGLEHGRSSSFPEVPDELLTRGWERVDSSPWVEREHVPLLEARAALWLEFEACSA